MLPGYLYNPWNLSRRFKKEFGDLLVTSSSPLCSLFQEQYLILITHERFSGV